jgi:predicted membrane channel-forming protein YqfA (hemolysin III family)
MLSSTSYHLFKDQHPRDYEFYLKVDLIGIVITICFMAICGCWIGFFRYPVERSIILIVEAIVFSSNIIFSLTPCYHNPRYFWMTATLNSLSILFQFALALSWYFYFANEIEIEIFFVDLMISFAFIFSGFFFFVTKFPERYFTKEKYGERVARIV